MSYAEPKNSEIQQQQASQQTKSVYVGKLPSGATEDALKEIFAKYGEVNRVFSLLPFSPSITPRIATCSAILQIFMQHDRMNRVACFLSPSSLVF